MSTATPDVAPDGSPVAFYRRLPAQGEPESIHAAVRAGTSILDLGCGPRRIAGPLLALGHPVTGVDDGAGMIAALPVGVEGVVADARQVRLGRRFGAVLLASHPRQRPRRRARLPRDRRRIHRTWWSGRRRDVPAALAPRTDPGDLRAIGDASIGLIDAQFDGDLLHARVRYGVDGREWDQSFSARLYDEAGLRTLLDHAGLTLVRWLDRPGWFLASAGARMGT